MTNNESEPSRLEKGLAFAFLACVALSVLAVIVILLAAFTNNVWIPNGLGLVPMLGFPLGFIFLSGVLILSARRKRKLQN